ncbi:MAG: hypothetical protein HOV67_15445 [Kribbellaceae bacterium]|nr:hypothetical protein [Kribbellaceae bacterium]
MNANARVCNRRLTGRGAALYSIVGNPVVCAAIAGGVCCPARWLVERHDWWKRLEQPTKRTVERRERALRRVEARETARVDGAGGQVPVGGGRHSQVGTGRPGWLRRLGALLRR